MSWVTVLSLTLSMSLLSVIIVVLCRYVPIIERNAFDVPRLQVPSGILPPAGLDVRDFQIPYDTRNAIQAQYIKAKSSTNRLVVFCHETGADLSSWYHTLQIPYRYSSRSRA